MTLTPKPHGFEIRLRYGQGQRERFLLRTKDATQAAEREPRMEALARKLASTPGVKGAKEALLAAAEAAAHDKNFAAVERVVDKLCAEVAGAPPPPVASGTLSTFRDVAEAWTSGKLTELYPDSKLVPAKTAKGRGDDRQTVSAFYPALGDKPMSEITIEDIDAARRLIPKDLHPNTRRGYLVRLRLLFRVAVSPLRLRQSAPEIDIPRRTASNLFGYLYPQEEALLLARTQIPLVYRVLYGYLARNGCRIGETLRLTWDHVDLETGDIHIDRKWTKTKRARRWVLDADVLEAFDAFYAHSGRPERSSRVFPGRQKKSLSAATVRKRFLDDVRDAGVRRKSITEGADGIGQLRVHDLRATFVTLALRAGKSLKWITTRTGHESLGVMQVYDRLVQDAEEHHLQAWFEPMARSIPEFARWLGGGPGVGQALKLRAEMALDARAGWTREPGKSSEKDREKAASVTHETPVIPSSGPAENKGVGQTHDSGPPSAEPADPVEQALAYALGEATKDHRYDVVLAVTRELEQRRLARQSSNVTSLADHRSKKGDGK